MQMSRTVSGSPGIDVRVTFTIPNGEVPDYVTIKAYYSGTDRRDVYLEVWNDTTSDWDYVTTVTLDEELDVYTVDLDPNHVFNDTLTMRFYHPDNGNPSYYLCVDYLAVTTEIQGVVAYWVFDDGNGHDLLIGGWTDYNDLLDDMTGTSPAYQGGHALKFPGVNEYLYIPAAQATKFNPGRGDFTIEGWIKTGSNITTMQGVFSKGVSAAGSKSFSLTIFNSQFLFRVYDDSGTWVSYNFNISPNTVYYFAMSISRTGEQFIFVNGSKVFTQSTSNLDDLSNNYNFYVGRRNEGDLFQGEIAAFRYSSKALTEQEIKESYGLAKGWSSGTYSIESKSVVYVNSEFSQKLIGQTDNKTDDAFVIQELPVQDGVLYKISATVVDKDITTERIDVKMAKHNGSPHPDMLVSLYQSDTTPFTYVGYFYGNTTYPYIWLAASNWADTGHYVIFDNVSIRPVLNAVQPANFVEDFSKGGARYVEITAANQGTQSTSQIYANSTKTNYYWGDGSSAEVIGDFRVTNGNHGIMMNDLEDDQPAHPAAFKYNGIDQYVDFGDVCDVGLNPFILFAWIKTDATTPTALRNIFDKRDEVLASGGKGYSLTQENQFDRLGFGMGDGTNFVPTYSDFSTFPINDNEWHFVAIVCDRKNAIGYIDGVKGLTVDVSSIGDISTTGNLVIGRQSFGTDEYWEDFIGLSGIYIFDGQDGAPAKMPERVERLIEYIYYQTKYWLKK